MDKEILEFLSRAQKITLMILYVDGNPIRGKVWYQKEIYLISKLDNQLKDQVEFEPHHYGPHSYEVQDALENLESDGLVDVNEEIKLTAKGKEAAEYIKREFKAEELEFYLDIKRFLNNLSRMELLAYIYQTNKDMTTQSVELQNVKSKLLDYVISLYEKDKLSVAKAAEIAEMPLDKFVAEIKKRGLKIKTGL